MAAIGLDLGASRLKAVVVENDGTILDQIGRPTRGEVWRAEVDNLLKELLAMYGDHLQIGVCAPGLPNRARDSIWDCAGKIPGLEGLNWREHLGWARPIPVMNDAQAALFGETWLGAAAGCKNVVLFTLGTGIAVRD